MTHHTPELDALLSSVSEWDKHLIEQAIYLFGETGRPLSMNDFRHLLPEMAHGMAGRVILSMINRKEPPIREIAKVRSTSRDTHKKEIGLYLLTETGHQLAREWHQKHTARAA